MTKFERFVCGVCTLVELGSIIGLAGLALKRNQECYEAEIKAINLEAELCKKEIDECYSDYEIRKLKQEIKELKEKYEPEEDNKEGGV